MTRAGGSTVLGVDFDNTLICYDGVFHAVSLEMGLIPEALPQTKEAVRDHLRTTGQEEAWTELQGTVYGSRLQEAEAFPGALATLAEAREAGIDLRIISHKTRRPYRGHPWDLHAAAWAWLEGQGLFPGVLARAHVAFLETQAEKLARIGAEGCTHFLDDLPEILAAPGFPGGTRRLLFGGAALSPGAPEMVRLRTWPDVSVFLEAMGSTP